MNTRRDNLMMILKFPLWIIGGIMFFVWMFFLMLLLAPLMILVGLPCLFLLLLSVFVGVISPSAGEALTRPLDWFGHLVIDRFFEVLLGKPLDLMDEIL